MGFIYFLNTTYSSNPDDHFLIDKYLKNKTKYREKGIDIRSNGGYVIIAPSEYDNGKYEFANNEKMVEMPTTFINWLLLGTEQKIIKKLEKIGKKQLNEFKFKITQDEFKNLLFKLDDSYCENTKKWLIITSIFKSLNYFQLWDDWSTMSKKYDKENNKIIWDNSEGLIDVNYLIYIINKLHNTKIESVVVYKKYNLIARKIQDKY